MHSVSKPLLGLFLLSVVASPGNATDPSTAPVQVAQAVEQEEALRMLKRGDELMTLGDISAARLFYEIAAAKGSGEGAAKLAATYDPVQLSNRGVIGIEGDAEKALSLYSDALRNGYAQAAVRLDRLETYMKSQGTVPTNRLADRSAPPPSATAPQGSRPAETAPTGSFVVPNGGARLLDVSERLDAGAPTASPSLIGQTAVIQLAALGSREAAIDTGVELQVEYWDLLGDKKLTIERLELSQGRGTMFGVRIGPFASSGSAEKLCGELKVVGQDCFVIE